MEAIPPAGLDDATWPVYTVGQVAQLLGVQPARSQGGQRRYSRTEIDRIQQVTSLASEGFTLPAIRRVLELQSEVTELRRQLAAERARSKTRGDRP
jgi:MerR family transcriptional regulator/heat shock protein HspR